MFVLYSKVGHKSREQVHFLILESWLALTYNFHLGADTGISNTSTSIASCYSLNSCKGCYKPPEAAITKLKKKHRQTLRSITGHVGLPPSHTYWYLPSSVLPQSSSSQSNLERRKGRLGKAGMLGPWILTSMKGKRYCNELICLYVLFLYLPHTDPGHSL